jgi:hypothetical protein
MPTAVEVDSVVGQALPLYWKNTAVRPAEQKVAGRRCSKRWVGSIIEDERMGRVQT